jgi:FtsZ-binding cell division protein ZapB
MKDLIQAKLEQLRSRFDSTKNELQQIAKQKQELEKQAAELMDYQKLMQGEYKALTELMEDLEKQKTTD